MKKFFKYIENLWVGRDGKLSLRSLGAMVLLTDFVINVHNASYVIVRVFDLIMSNKIVDAAIIASLSGYLAQIAMILGIEAALIAALLALKTYQPFPGSNPLIGESSTTIVQQPVQQTPQVGE